jgi:hypothetical protein
MAISLANAYLVHLKKRKLTTEEYPHGDFKMEVVRGLLECAEQVSKASVSWGIKIHRSAEVTPVGPAAQHTYQC